MAWPRLAAFVAASGALHASLGLVEQARDARDARVGPAVEPVQLDFTIDEGLPLAPEAPSQPPEPPRPRPRTREKPAPAVSPAPLPAEAPEPASPAPEPPRRAQPAGGVVDISPLSAARALVDVRAAPQAAPSGPREKVTVGVPLDTYLRAELAPRSLSTRSEDPQLSPRRGGGYSFDGNGFDATIDPDGSVHFDDKYGSFSLLPKKHDGGPTLWVFNVSFDLTAWFEKVMGNDPYRSERRWFIERTAELRERLAQAAFERVSARARQNMRHSLQRVWNDATLSLREKKRETFEHWDMNAEDEVGELGREQVEGFVRERCPLGSDCAFSEQDLAWLNGLRRSRSPFAPYSQP